MKMIVYSPRGHMCPAGQLLGSITPVPLQYMPTVQTTGSITPVPLQYMPSVQARQIPWLGKG